MADLASVADLVEDLEKLSMWLGRTDEFHELMFGGRQKVE